MKSWSRARLNISKSQIEQIRILIKQGVPVKQVAQNMKISDASLYKLMKANNIPLPYSNFVKPGAYAQYHATWRTKYANGMSANSIAKQYGVAPTTVWNAIHKVKPISVPTVMSPKTPVYPTQTAYGIWDYIPQD